MCVKIRLCIRVSGYDMLRNDRSFDNINPNRFK